MRNLPGIRCLGRNGARVGTTRQAPQANITWKHGDTQEREQAAALAAEEAKRAEADRKAAVEAKIER